MIAKIVDSLQILLCASSGPGVIASVVGESVLHYVPLYR